MFANRTIPAKYSCSPVGLASGLPAIRIIFLAFSEVGNCSNFGVSQKARVAETETSKAIKAANRIASSP